MRIVHLADLHLGYRAYHRVTARGVNLREEDIADAFRRAVEQTVALRPDLVLVAGDIFHSVRPSNAAIAGAFRQFSLLTAALPGVPVVLIAGNHDSPRSADTGNILALFREVPGLVVVTESAEGVRLPALDTTVLCLPHNALAEPDLAVLNPDPSARVNLLMLHGTVGGSVAEQKLRYVTEFGGALVDDTQIGPERWDYVALGHYHLATELAPNMWYAGGVERCSTNVWMEADTPKGFLLFDTETRRAEFHEVATRPVVDLPRASARGLGAKEVDALIEAALAAVPGGIAGKIVRLVLADLPRPVLRELDHRRIREYKAEALHFHLDGRAPEVIRLVGSGAPMRRQTLDEQVEGYLRKHWSLRAEALDRERLVTLGQHYVARTASDRAEDDA